MDRTEYLLLCQKASKCTGRDFPSGVRVLFDGMSYVPLGYEMMFENGKPIHRAVLHDGNANSVVYAQLEKVKR